jgi:hypothetical protein
MMACACNGASRRPVFDKTTGVSFVGFVPSAAILIAQPLWSAKLWARRSSLSYRSMTGVGNTSAG